EEQPGGHLLPRELAGTPQFEVALQGPRPFRCLAEAGHGLDAQDETVAFIPLRPHRLDDLVSGTRGAAAGLLAAAWRPPSRILRRRCLATVKPCPSGGRDALEGMNRLRRCNGRPDRKGEI